MTKKLRTLSLGQFFDVLIKKNECISMRRAILKKNDIFIILSYMKLPKKVNIAVMGIFSYSFIHLRYIDILKRKKIGVIFFQKL